MRLEEIKALIMRARIASVSLDTTGDGRDLFSQLAWALEECRKQAALIRKMYSKEFTLLMRYKHALERIHTMAGHPNAVGACISIIAFVERTLGEKP